MQLIENKQREVVLIADSFTFFQKDCAISDTGLRRQSCFGSRPGGALARRWSLACPERSRGVTRHSLVPGAVEGPLPLANRVSMGNKNAVQLTQNKESEPFLIEFFRHNFSTRVRFQTLASATRARICAMIFSP